MKPVTQDSTCSTLLIQHFGRADCFLAPIFRLKELPSLKKPVVPLRQNELHGNQLGFGGAVVGGATIIESQIPDHQTRLAACDRAVNLLGGIPKVGESTPAAHGLNVFITVDPKRSQVETRPSHLNSIVETVR